MGELVFYLVAIIVLGGYMLHKAKSSKHDYINIEEWRYPYDK